MRKKTLASFIQSYFLSVGTNSNEFLESILSSSPPQWKMLSSGGFLTTETLSLVVGRSRSRNRTEDSVIVVVVVLRTFEAITGSKQRARRQPVSTPRN